MAFTHSPNRPSRTARRRQAGALPSESAADRISRKERDQRRREHRLERAFTIGFSMIFILTLFYLIARSPLSSFIHI